MSEGALKASPSFWMACCIAKQQHLDVQHLSVFPQAEDGWLGYRTSSSSPCFASPALPYRKADEEEISSFPVPSRLLQLKIALSTE